MQLKKGHTLKKSRVAPTRCFLGVFLCVGIATSLGLSCASCTSFGKKSPVVQSPPPVQQDTAVFGTYDNWTFRSGTWVKESNAKLILTESSMTMLGSRWYPTQEPDHKDQQLIIRDGQIAKYATVNGQRLVYRIFDYYLQSPEDFGVPILWIKPDWTPSATLVAAPDPGSASLEQILAFIPEGLTPTDEAFDSLVQVKNVPFRHFWQTSTDIFGLAFYNNYLLASDFAAPCVDTVDISHPETAAIVGTWTTDQTHPWDNTEGILIHGQTAYIACGKAGVRVFSLKDPTNLAFLRQIDTGITYTVTRSGNSGSYAEHVIYTNANSSGNFVAVDLVSSEVPVLYTFSEGGGNGWNYDILKKADYLYCAGGDRFLIYNARNPNSPELLSTIVSAGSANTVQNVCISGGYAFVHGLSGDDSIDVVSISNPRKPLIVYTIGGLYSGGRIAIHGSYLFYIGPEKDQGLYVFDIKDPENPSMIKYYPEIRGHNIAFKDSYVFVTAGADGLNIYRRQ